MGQQRRRRCRAAPPPAVRHPAARRADAGQARARGVSRRSRDSAEPSSRDGHQERGRLNAQGSHRRQHPRLSREADQSAAGAEHRDADSRRSAHPPAGDRALVRRAIQGDRARARSQSRLARLDRAIRRAHAMGRRSRRCRRDGAVRFAARALSRHAPRVRGVT